MDRDFVFSGMSIVSDEIMHQTPSDPSSVSSFHIHRNNLQEASSLFTSSDMEISSSDSSADSVSFRTSESDSRSTCSGLGGNSLDDSCSHPDSIIGDSNTNADNQSRTIPDQTPPPVISFLDEEEIASLLGENIKLPPPQPREVLEKDNVDVIASFNVRNKYDHTTAAELLINEKITFLSIQEPYASSHKAAESWKAFQKLELQTARISCYETPYQMILFDAWKWGGKVLTAFQSLQYGRIASISFDLGDKLKLGIISIYAPTKDSNLSSVEDSDIHPSMKITNNLVQKIISKWKYNHPDMVTIILGDLQETVSSLDRDNLGKFRSDLSSDGVLANLLHSHTSIVREKNPDISYVTRFGQEGARGIDHILFPVDDKFYNICVDAKIKRDTGANYFPSDHSMITCSINRKGQNNNCSGFGKAKYDYNKLFSIKMKQSGRLGENISLDTTQFKDCKKFKEQSRLFAEIQKRTGDSAPRTKSHLLDLEARTGALFKSLWEDGVLQKIDNSSNNLVEVSDHHALELSYILERFNSAVKSIMWDLKLVDEKNTNDAAGATRGRLRTRKGFKLFNNLPVPTKLRYLKSNVEAKLKEVSKNIYWLKEFHIRNTYGTNSDCLNISQEPFWRQWHHTLCDEKLIKNATEVSIAYKDEESERLLHVEAIQHEQSKSHPRRTQGSSRNNNESKAAAGNTLPHVPNNVTRLLNFWLSNSNCRQGFDASSPVESTAFLSHRILDWKEILTEMDVNEYNLSIPHHSKLINSALEKAQSDLHKLCVQITKLQSHYRKSTLDYYLDTNNISSFTNKVSFKSKQAPAAHTSIWDPSLMEFRTCVDEMEELQATSAFHGNWMANSAADETCAFAEIVSVGRLGYRGVKLKPNRVVTMKDIASLIPNGQSLPRRIQKTFVKAHGLHTANLFREPENDNPDFFYPFYLLDETGKMSNEDTLEKGLWKSIASVPSKARFEGFQLAVLGRFSIRWRRLLLQIVKLILIMRYVPSILKRMARFPIPKPGRQNEYRPISLCHDLYCYIMSVVTSYSSAAIERAGILHEGITAYQKGKGCSNLVTTELCFREDCLENSVPSVQIDEDEEKFFDRIPVEILLAAMRINGFPSTGYIEIKASAMESKTVEIITAKGITYARFVCGLEQGNPDSPTVSNLVIKFKHDIWSFISKDIKVLLEKNNSLNNEGYKFNSIDIRDGQVYLCKIGYSDDNSKYISLRNEEDLLKLVKYFTQLSGDISMVTKIGRKSSKCEIQFFNITASLALEMQKTWSTAWSFVDDSPIEEEIPFKIHFRPEEYKSFLKLSNFVNLSEDEQIKWQKIIGYNAHKHLGLSCTLGADTSTSWRKTIDKMREKITKLNIYKMHISAQRKCFNMLVGTIPTFAPIQVNFPSSELLQFDQHAAVVCMKSNGLSKSDSRIRMFLPEKYGGLGLISTMELDIISVAREFEIISNNVSLDSRSFRTRISALNQYPLHSLFDNKNHARDTISKLARYGIYIRCADEPDINRVLSTLNSNNKSFLSFNHPDYRDKCTLGIGLGKDRNLKLMYGGPIHKILRLLEKNGWKSSSDILEIAKPYRVAVKTLLKIHNDNRQSMINDLARFFSFWEWRNINFQQIECIPSDIDEWEETDFKEIYESEGSYKIQDGYSFRSYCTTKSEIAWTSNVRYDAKTESLLFNPYTWEGKFLRYLMNSKSPILIATDGSHVVSNESSSTSSSFVLCVLDIRENESLHSEEWINRPVIPLLSRISMLPRNFGTSKSDIAHGEFCALLLAQVAFLQLPRVTISDSKAIREQFLKLRNLSSDHTDRNYIRNIAGGIGKFVSGVMKDSLFQSKASNRHFQESDAMKIIIGNLDKRNSSFLSIAQTWTISSSPQDQEEVHGWDKNYFDEDVSFPVLKVNSHQLDHTGTKIKNPPRYRKLIPNLAMLSANHHADVCAEYGRNFHSTSYNFDKPPLHLRFFLSCGGKHVDRNISDFCHDQFSLLKIRKLKLKKTQGLLWRVLGNTSTTWGILQLHKGWLRSLLGLSSTHSRRTYKSEVYRSCCKAKILSESDDTCHMAREFESANAKKIVDILKNCMWCKPTSGGNQIGNRNHAILFCGHEDLSYFRTRITNLIESKFRLFFLELSRATNRESVYKCIKEVETTFLDLQHRNVDRLAPIEPIHNNRYLPIQSILSRENLSDIHAALKSPKFNFCCEVFGLLPQSSAIPIRDDQIGLVDCTWLGLMPQAIDNILKEQCENIKSFITHQETAMHLYSSLNQSWQEIKNLIMGKAIGIHRIICSTGKRLEKTWRKEYDIDINTISKLKRDSNPTSTTKVCTNLESNSGKKRKYRTSGGIPIAFHVKRSKLINTDTNIQENISVKKSCTGLTCSRRYESWYPNSNFAQNHIKTSIKQCQRCSRYMTAIKACIAALEEMEATPNKNFEDLVDFIREHRFKMQYKYFAFIDKFNASLPPASRASLRAKTGIVKKVPRVSDRFKLICNVFCIAISKASHNFSIIDANLPRQALSIFNILLSRKESDFNLDREAEAKIRLLITNNNKIPCGDRKEDTNHQKCSISSSTESINSVTRNQQPCTSNTDKTPYTSLLQQDHKQTSKKVKFQNKVRSTSINEVSVQQNDKLNLESVQKHHTVQIVSILRNKPKKALGTIAAMVIRPNRYLPGEAMTRAIEILRSYKVQDVYFASAEAANQISSWRNTDGWTKFAKMFGSRNIMHNKLNGTYFIPLFSGDTTMGHWSLCVVKKISQRNIEAWCVDSMGTGNTTGPIHTKITTAFAPGRARLTWKTCRCRCQEEVECGPRTILAMKLILEGISSNMQMETCIEKATMTQLPHANYTPSKIREETAHLINLFTSDMITPPIRLRERGRRRTLAPAARATNTRENPCEILE